jgi:polyisoprenyl-teichoic acid--peptidoglycan teichoic acid transferase
VRPEEPGRTGDEREEPRRPEDAGESAGPAPATWAGRREQESSREAETEAPRVAGAEGAGEADGKEGVGEAGAEEGAGEAAGEGDGAGTREDEIAGEAGEGQPEAGEGSSGEGAGGIPAREAVAAQDTVEADTLALADREQAEEAALAGLKARAAEYAAKRARETPAPVPGAGPEAGEAPEPVAAAAAPEAPQPAPAASATPSTEAPPAAEQGDEGPRPRGLWARFLAASLLIVISTATATSVSLLLVLTDLARGLGGIPGIERQLVPVGSGEPHTLLILGSDERHGEGGDEGGARSDTAILLRVDPGRDAIGLLSIPRDLKVNVPGVGVDKFNAAYANSGPRLALRVVKQLTGLDVNHVVNINFTGFADAVNAIDCVFVDVDRRYYVPSGDEYSAIDPPIEPGYQRLCGLKALQYVRFRRDDNDLVRAARQQDFLREARQKIPPSKMFSDRTELIDIFKRYTTSDRGLEDPIQLLELLKTFLAARHATVNEIHFPADLGDGDSPYVTANQKAIRRTVDEFLGVEGTPGPKPGSARAKMQRREGDRDRERQRQRSDRGPAMIDAPGVRDHARLVADETNRRGERRIDFPIFFPAEIPARTTLTPIDASRAFPIDGPAREVHEGYKLVLGIPGGAGFTEYWGVSGTSWDDPPILENPSATREIGGREYLLFYDTDRLRLVGWKQGGNSYWINNTLLQSLSEAEMLATARSMRRLDG